MKPYSSASAFIGAAVFAALVTGTSFGARATAAQSSEAHFVAQPAGTATPIPPPTDEPTEAPAATPTPAPRRVPRSRPTHAPAPSPTPFAGPSATPIPLPRAPRTSATAAAATPTPIPLPKARASSSKSSAPASTGSGVARYTTIRQYERQPDIARALRDPIPDLSRIAWMSGTWSCTISTHDDPHAALKASLQTTYVYDFTLNKRWMFGADGKGTEQHEITFDPIAKRWVFVRLSSNPSYGIAHSATGWSGDKITFEDDVEFVDGRDTHRRWTLTKHSNSHFTITDEEQTLEGDWLLEDEYDFNKST